MSFTDPVNKKNIYESFVSNNITENVINSIKKPTVKIIELVDGGNTITSFSYPSILLELNTELINSQEKIDSIPINFPDKIHISEKSKKSKKSEKSKKTKQSKSNLKNTFVSYPYINHFVNKLIIKSDILPEQNIDYKIIGRTIFINITNKLKIAIKLQKLNENFNDLIREKRVIEFLNLNMSDVFPYLKGFNLYPDPIDDPTTRWFKANLHYHLQNINNHNFDSIKLDNLSTDNNPTNYVQLDFSTLCGNNPVKLDNKNGISYNKNKNIYGDNNKPIFDEINGKFSFVPDDNSLKCELKYNIKKNLFKKSNIYRALYENIINSNLSYDLAWYGNYNTQINAIYYFIYDNDSKTDDFISYLENISELDLFKEYSKKCLKQSLYLLKNGLIHSSLVSMYHNIDNNRPFLLTIDIFKFWYGRYGTGRLSTIFSAGKYSNFRVMGLADFGEIVSKNFMKEQYINIFNNYDDGVNIESLFMLNNRIILDIELLSNQFFSWIIVFIRRMLLDINNNIYNISYSKIKESADLINEMFTYFIKTYIEINNPNSLLGGKNLNNEKSYYKQSQILIDSFLNNILVLNNEIFIIIAKQIHYTLAPDFINNIINNKTDFLRLLYPQKFYQYISVQINEIKPVRGIINLNNNLIGPFYILFEGSVLNLFELLSVSDKIIAIRQLFNKFNINQKLTLFEKINFIIKHKKDLNNIIISTSSLFNEYYNVLSKYYLPILKYIYYIKNDVVINLTDKDIIRYKKYIEPMLNSPFNLPTNIKNSLKFFKQIQSIYKNYINNQHKISSDHYKNDIINLFLSSIFSVNIDADINFQDIFYNIVLQYSDMESTNIGFNLNKYGSNIDEQFINFFNIESNIKIAFESLIIKMQTNDNVQIYDDGSTFIEYNINRFPINFNLIKNFKYGTIDFNYPDNKKNNKKINDNLLHLIDAGLVNGPLYYQELIKVLLTGISHSINYVNSPSYQKKVDDYFNSNKKEDINKIFIPQYLDSSDEIIKLLFNYYISLKYNLTNNIGKQLINKIKTIQSTDIEYLKFLKSYTDIIINNYTIGIIEYTISDTSFDSIYQKYSKINNIIYILLNNKYIESGLI